MGSPLRSFRIIQVRQLWAYAYQHTQISTDVWGSVHYAPMRIPIPASELHWILLTYGYTDYAAI
eukprot:3941974-Rhodomonas_salina.5